MKAHWGVWGTRKWQLALIWFPQYVIPIDHFNGRPTLLLLNNQLCNHGQWAFIKMYHVCSMYFRCWSLKSSNERIKNHQIDLNSISRNPHKCSSKHAYFKLSMLSHKLQLVHDMLVQLLFLWSVSSDRYPIPFRTYLIRSFVEAKKGYLNTKDSREL